MKSFHNYVIGIELCLIHLADVIERLLVSQSLMQCPEFMLCSAMSYLSMVLLGPNVNHCLPYVDLTTNTWDDVYLWCPKLSLTGHWKLEILLDRRPTDLMMCWDGTL